ncbi:hypothetical protein [uncultured Dokdonia sp.]|uniref:glycine-rich domain-containing protein n=1 Tax=uncultured Dokdonia sp. TaxID=575653 RepID=UPI0026136135|nr:hypothetical protein [uncultured Dokdonia sp.]
MRDTALWSRINAFTLDDTNATFTFSKRLARDNNWSKDFTEKTIQEYKKFIYLCCVSSESITPSDAVDQVWHLHLTYTKSYWIDFCKNTLQKEIHHNPTKGGDQEKKKFNSCYNATFDRYKEEFQETPPAAIWLDTKTRFAQINFQRINIDKYWMIKKPTSLRLSSLVLTLVLTLIASLYIQAKGSFIIFLFIIVLIIIAGIANKGKGKNNDSGCTYDDYDSDWGDSGCSGCSGCGD